MEIIHAVLIWLKPFLPWLFYVGLPVVLCASYTGKLMNETKGPQRFDKLTGECLPVAKRKFPQSWLKDVLTGLAFLLIALPIIVFGGGAILLGYCAAFLVR